MNEFAEQYNTLYRCQFEFRKNHSTSHALIHLMNRISSAIDQRETTVGVFLDLSKAFDTLDHQILFTKLEHYGIRDVALQWIKSYFSCRQQFVQINQTCSSMQTIKCGVPQGSILGPLFFILYINDLPKASKLTELLLFADDTSIFFSHSNPNYLENVLNNELLNIDVWLRCNKLSVNIKKTNYVTFSPSQRKLNHSFSLSFGGQPLIQSNVTKFLGVHVPRRTSYLEVSYKLCLCGLALAWRRNRSRIVEQEAVIAIFHLYTPLMSSKRKGRSSAASQSSNQSPEEKRSKNSETDEVFEALEMAEDVDLKLQRVLDKLEKLDKIEAHLSEVSASLASIEEKVSRLDEDVQSRPEAKNKQGGKESVRIGRKYPVQRRRHFRPKERVKGVKLRTK